MSERLVRFAIFRSKRSLLICAGWCSWEGEASRAGPKIRVCRDADDVLEIPEGRWAAFDIFLFSIRWGSLRLRTSPYMWSPSFLAMHRTCG